MRVYTVPSVVIQGRQTENASLSEFRCHCQSATQDHILIYLYGSLVGIPLKVNQFHMDDSKTFREELAIRYPTLGHALWELDPWGLYNAVQVGDVGFIKFAMATSPVSSMLYHPETVHQIIHLNLILIFPNIFSDCNPGHRITSARV